VSDAYAYDPYGNLLGHTGDSDQPFTYVGQYGVRREPVGSLYDMRARVYDPQTARFLTRDLLWPVLGDIDSLNPYQYAYQNPLRYVDPAGAYVFTGFGGGPVDAGGTGFGVSYAGPQGWSAPQLPQRPGGRRGGGPIMFGESSREAPNKPAGSQNQQEQERQHSFEAAREAYEIYESLGVQAIQETTQTLAVGALVEVFGVAATRANLLVAGAMGWVEAGSHAYIWATEGSGAAAADAPITYAIVSAIWGLFD
jgi:RHS repeat-associated protein